MQLQVLTKQLKPYTVLALLLTLCLIFTFQGQVVLQRPLDIVLIAAPLILQTVCMFALAFGLAYLWSIPFQIAVSSLQQLPLSWIIFVKEVYLSVVTGAHVCMCSLLNILGPSSVYCLVQLL
jgi:hypothetical protein